jgi:hypothetical protein
MSEYEVFKKKFACKPEFTGYVTCEREVSFWLYIIMLVFAHG